MRCYTGKQSYKVEVIGIADDVSNANGVSVLSFSQAQQKARELRDQRDRTAAGKSGPLTVGEAMKSYLQWLKDEGKPTVDAKVRIDRVCHAGARRRAGGRVDIAAGDAVALRDVEDAGAGAHAPGRAAALQAAA